MEINESLRLSLRLHEMLRSNLSHAFSEHIPVGFIEEKARSLNPKSRECIFTPVNVILTMLLTAIQEDKSLQNGLNLFKTVFESDCNILIREEEARLNAEKLDSCHLSVKAGRPRQFKSRLPKRYQNSLSDCTGGYSTARKNLDVRLVEDVYAHSTDFGALDKERWHGMKTYIGDGTYLQLQDTDDIKSLYKVKGMENSYPQALLQVLIRQGTGQVSQYALGSRNESELRLVIPMINNLEANSLLLCDDLYNTYYHFCLALSRQCHMIVPGKRARNYKVVRRINDNDQIVEISKTVRPEYVSKEEWNRLPKTILLRRITYAYPTKNGEETAVLYTTILDENIKTSEIITKYTMRWDIEISIREVKTIMDINVLRSKSRDMMLKELLIALTAYNLLRKKIAESADPVGFSPQNDIFQKFASFGRTVLLDKRGRVFYKRSPGRYGYADKKNKKTTDSASKRKTTALSKKNQTGKISKI
jgi:hypothetical protein